MEYEAAVKYLKENNDLYQIENKVFGGVSYKVLSNIPKCLPDLLEYASPMLSGKTYIVYDKRRISYEQFLININKIAHSLINNFRIKKGDKVAIVMRNYPEYLMCLMGIIRAGGVAVLLNAWWTENELLYGFKDSGAKLAFVDLERYQRLKRVQKDLHLNLILISPELKPKKNTTFYCFEEILNEDKPSHSPNLPKVEGSDEFAIMYSSGSTSFPKGVVLTNIGALNAIFSWKMFVEVHKLMNHKTEIKSDFEPAILCATPLFHVTASHPTFFLSLALGAKIVLMHKWDPQIALKLIDQEKITRFLGVPTMTADMTLANKSMQLKIPSLQYLGSGGAKRPAAQVSEQAIAFPNASLASGWGMTETNALGLGCIGYDYIRKPYSTGRLYPPIQQMKIIDQSGNEVQVGAAGELCVKSIANMKEYLNNESSTQATINGGWLRTGDKARVDGEGFVTILGRLKEVIIRGGENISCSEVEEVLYRYSSILEASVFAVPDDRFGEEVGALLFINPNSNINLQDLKKFLDLELAKFKHPKYHWISNSPLPRGGTDKINKTLIRELCVNKDYFSKLS